MWVRVASVVELAGWLGPTIEPSLRLSGTVASVRGSKEHALLQDFVTVISAALRLPAGAPPSSWTLSALSRPATRIFTETREAPLERLAPALLDQPSGTRADLDLLWAMRGVEDHRLDDLAVAWIEAARSSGDEASAACAARIALIRLGYLDEDGNDDRVCRGEGMLERWDRLDGGVSAVDASSLRDAIESRRAFYEAMTRSLFGGWALGSPMEDHSSSATSRTL